MQPLTNDAPTLPTATEACRALNWSIAALALMAIAEGAALAVADMEWGYGQFFRGPADATGYVYDVALRADGNMGVSLFSASDARLRDAYRRCIGFHRFKDRVATTRRSWPQSAYPASVAAIPGSARFAIGCNDGAIYVMDGELPATPPVFFGRHGGNDLRSMQCSADGRRLLSLGRDHISCWDLASHGMLWQRYDTTLNAAAFDPDSRRLVTAANDGSVHEVDASTGRTIKLVASIRDTPSTIALTHDGQYMAVATFSTLSVWNRDVGTRLWSCLHPQSQLSFSPDDSLLCSFSKVGKSWILALREPTTGRLVATLPGHPKRVFGTTFSADGTLCSWGGDGTIRFWNPAIGEQINAESLETPW